MEPTRTKFEPERVAVIAAEGEKLVVAVTMEAMAAAVWTIAAENVAAMAAVEVGLAANAAKAVEVVVALRIA